MSKAGFTETLKRLFRTGTALSDDFFDDLSDTLVEGDFGAAEAYKTVERLQTLCRKEGIREAQDAREALARLLSSDLEAIKPFEEAQDAFTIILLLGVNGVGKTTTAAKLAMRSKKQGADKPVLAAADTFRAAAIDQLKIHGDRLGLRVVAHKPGADPAAVVFDAIDAAKAAGSELIIADTAGRMHTRTALVEELKKIDRIVSSKAADARYLKYLVLDATTGRNAVAQAEIFHEAVSIDAVILTKYDSSARGGVVFSLADTLKLPVAYVCTGESYEDIALFDAGSYVREFLGLE